ncbi:MAG: GntR family transcriptional regulator [Sphaerochaetaceae bacterium]|jgi:DNA-binding GntR family transcriptional regulator|nr:GntR family transcriptional regulator [Sphaerochaetaceae bacterium]NLO61083.1 GntR family transcriptional regulator [Spirochaetales bacterium]MDD2405300.1 GntR family transcriptional regulator [Sphaerochaetaceae bacterium]MDD3670201.1 GntR family transcriptional regulator [Sphaerochaetaceae bacterium]MDD4259937.1 GntR family transcriptional regulator [Sphaerochaetaceae bacterium]
MPLRTNQKVILTIKDQVYQIIRDNILSEQLKPGDRINEVQIAKDLNVSRSPVRSAINELIGEGLLESIPNKFVKVRKLTEKQILDIYELRLLVEGYAVEKTIEHLDEEMKRMLCDFRDQFIACSTYAMLDTYVEIDTQFHEFLIKASGNDVVYETLHRVALLINPFRVISLKSEKRFIESIDEHIELIEAICNKNLEKARERCKTHLTLAKNEIVNYLKTLHH